MTKAKTKNGRTVWLSFVPDCEYNTGGWYVEVYLNQYGDRYDDFCVHLDDCDCTDMNAVEQYAKDYVSGLVY
jgi:hypothetical protein